MGLQIVLMAAQAHASDRPDALSAVADPKADIGDLYAWTSYDGRRLNLVMTIAAQTFSKDFQYAFHIDSGARFGHTSASATIVCQFPQAGLADCAAGNDDRAFGNASVLSGLAGRNQKFRVFAGLRGDPRFDDVEGARDASEVVAHALASAASIDASGCPQFDESTSRELRTEWRRANGGPAANSFAGRAFATLVVSVDLSVVDRGGPFLAIWATTSTERGQMDRMGRPSAGAATLGLFTSDNIRGASQVRHSTDAPTRSSNSIQELQKTLAVYDSLDGECGNQWLAEASIQSPARYQALATLLADDRLWVNSESSLCTQFMAVELAQLSGQPLANIDCGGRTPTANVIGVYRSLLVTGEIKWVDDHDANPDESAHSLTEFPFLASP